MITDLKTLQEWLDGHMRAFNDLSCSLRSNEQLRQDRVFIDVYLAHHVTEFRGIQRTFATMVGTRHMLELEQTGPLSAPDDLFQEIDLAGLKECIPVFRAALNKLANKSREIHDLYESLDDEVTEEDSKE